MLKDITIGQYYPGNSFVHRLDPRFKIIITLLYITMLFMGSHLYSMVFGIVFFFLTFFCSGIAAKVLLKSMKPILPILLITAILDLLFIRDGTVYWSLGFLQITQEGVKTGVQMIIRISFLIVGTSMLTYTTSPIALTDAIERCRCYRGDIGRTKMKQLHLSGKDWLAMSITLVFFAGSIAMKIILG